MRLMLVGELRSGMIVGENVYPSTYSIMPLIREDTALTTSLITKMIRRGVKSILIKEAFDKPAQVPTRKIETRAGSIVLPVEEPVVSSKLKDSAVGNLEELFTTISIGNKDVHTSALKVVQHLDLIVEQLVDSLESDRGTLINISDLKSFDEYTYHHSLSVAVLSIAIAQRIGMSEDEMNRIGRCAIMHDIGKTSVPIEVIHKPSRLTDQEFRLIKTHSPSGYDYLERNGIGDEDMWRGVLHHHEKPDGTGYPYGLSGDQIPVWSRIISVADVYDALTSNRPYREPMQPAEAAEYIMGGVGASFDYKVVESFVKKLSLYPLGSFVQLSNGEIAVVVDTENHMRPIVQVADTGAVYDLFRDRSLLNIVISRIVPESQMALQEKVSK